MTSQHLEGTAHRNTAEKATIQIKYYEKIFPAFAKTSLEGTLVASTRVLLLSNSLNSNELESRPGELVAKQSEDRPKADRSSTCNPTQQTFHTHTANLTPP
jgi:hypothetical protein